MTALILVLLIVLAILIVIFFIQRFHHRKAAVSPYTEGLILLLDGRNEEALAKLRQAVSADTSNVDAYLRLADLHHRQGDLDRSLQIERALIARRGLTTRQEIDIYTRLGRSYLATGQTERAILIYEELVKLDKKNIPPHENLLELYCQTGKWEECAALLKTLSRLQTDRHRFALYLAETGRALAAKNPTAGIDHLKRALKVDPKNTAALFWLGQVYASRSAFNPAIDCWQRILDNNPRDAFLVTVPLEQAYLDSGNYGLVIPVYEKILKKTPDESALALALARIYVKKGDTGKALDVLRRATEAKPAPLEPWLRLLALQLVNGEVERTERGLDRLAERISEHGYHCRVCRFTTDSFLWHCPSCKNWETFGP